MSKGPKKARATVRISTAGLRGFLAPPGVEIVWDDVITGFGLRTRGGTERGAWRYIFRYRHKATGRQVTLTMGAGEVGSPRFQSGDEARKWAERQAKRANEAGDPWEADQRKRAEHLAEKRRPTVSRLWEEWRAAEGAVKKDAKNDERRWTRYLKPWFGKMKVAEITPAEVNRFKLSFGKKSVTANRCLALLSVMMTFAIAHQYRAGCAPEHPIKGRVVKRNKETPVDFYYTPEELGRILEAADSEPNRAAGLIIRMLALTGARASEVMKAHWGQFDEMDDGRLKWTVERTNTKTGEPYSRTLGLDLSRRLRDWRPLSLGVQKVVKKGEPRWVFPQTGHSKNSSTDKPMIRIHQAWKRVKKAAGVRPEGRLHDLRHTAATTIVSKTGSLEAAKRQLGHATILTTQRYAHHVPEMAAKTGELLEGQGNAAIDAAKSARERARIIPIGGA